MESGTRIGPYEVQEPLGAGGMGEVWIARDTKLDRRVAIKILPADLARDTDRLARFEQEARALAALNHPNIAQVFGLEQAAEAPVIAMELVEGRDLANVLESGPLPIDEALAIASQIASAVGTAHEAGIVHRDLKPANVVVRDDGTVKVLDFGLAKTGDGTRSGISGLTESPTVLSPAMTATGVIMGTAAYMAPEQAKGRPVDRRADVWAFGCVLYEMLVGERPFRGGDVAEMMASVLKDEADLEALPADTPASIRRLLERCLRKAPENRLDSLIAARLEIEEAGSEPAGDTAAGTRPSALALGAVAAAALLVGVWLGFTLAPNEAADPGEAEREAVRRALVPLPPGTALGDDELAFSRDGTTVVFAARTTAKPRLYVHRLDSMQTEEIPGTEGAAHPFFSPDGGHVGFFVGGQLRKVSVRGGSRDVTVLCDAPTGQSGAWDSSGWIYFTFGESRLARVREAGGEPEQIEKLANVFGLRALPDGRGILLTEHASDAPSIRKDTAEIGVLSLQDGSVTPVLSGGYNPRYLSSGHLVFMRNGGLFAVRFDLETLATEGPEVSVQPGVRGDSIWGDARYDIADDGTLVYAAGGDFARTRPTWVDLETGAEEPLPVPYGVYNNFDLTPDGTRLAVHNGSGAQDQIYVYDARRESFSRLTLEGANIYPVWSPDGSEVFFASSRGGDGYRIYRKPVDGSAPATRVLSDEQTADLSPDPRWPLAVAPDQSTIVFMIWGENTEGGDLWMAPLDGTGRAEPLVKTASNEILPQVSPDGRWVAYGTDRAGPYQIVVAPYPDASGPEWVLSGDIDSFDSRWNAAGDEVFYRSLRQLVRVRVGGGDELVPGMPEMVLEIDFHDSAGLSFDLSPDGRRVLVNKPDVTLTRDDVPLTLVTGFATVVAEALAAQN